MNSSGSSVSIPQDLSSIATHLPRLPINCSTIIVKNEDFRGCVRSHIVRRSVVQVALIWLIQNNPLYSNILIDQQALDSLHVNKIPQGILFITAATPVEEEEAARETTIEANQPQNVDVNRTFSADNNLSGEVMDLPKKILSWILVKMLYQLIRTEKQIYFLNLSLPYFHLDHLGISLLQTE